METHKKINKKQIFTLDFWGSLIFSFEYFRNMAYSKICTLIMLVVCKIKKIEIGSHPKFWGKSNFSRYPGSKIIIGSNCNFASSSHINYRGISHNCIFQTGKENALIKIGSNCGFSGCSIVSDKEVIVGDEVLIGSGTLIGDRDDHSSIYASTPSPVVIGNNVWIGMHCIILKGVHIGDNTIIGAGSIVTKDIPSNCIAAGNPCVVKKNRRTQVINN